MGFDASKVSTLSYDFSQWDTEDTPIPEPVSGDIPEPTTVQIAAFWGAMEDLMQTYRRKLDSFQKRIDDIRPAEGASKDALDDFDKRAAAIEDEYRAWSKESGPERLAKRREYLANVCSGSPSYDTLTALPGRIYDAFERYVQEELGPLGSGAAITR